jgi:hypothetical protein
MTTLSTRVLLMAAPIVLIAGAASGCTPTTGTAAPPATAPASASAPAPGTGGGGADATSAPPAGKGGGGVPACRPQDVRAAVTGQSHRSRGDVRMAMITMSNVSDRACTLTGWPTVALVDAHGDNAPVESRTVNEPGAPYRIEVKAGGGVFAGIKWTTCQKFEDTCAVGNTLVVGVPGSGEPSDTAQNELPAPEKSDITIGSLQVGTLQGSNQGVVAW